jgi:hypothetical protein
VIIDANRRWSNAVDSHLWLYVMRYEAENANQTPQIANEWTPIEIFSACKVMPITRMLIHLDALRMLLIVIYKGLQKALSGQVVRD